MAKDELPTSPPTLDIPPRTSIDDPGAHELESDTDDHFSDARSGRNSQSGPTSPIPVTRVEKVDDEPSYGEVPGTDAYKMRTQDAHPDQIAVVGSPELQENVRPSTPGGQPIPLTIVERVDDKPAHGEVPGTPAHAKHAADAVPDLLIRSGSRSRSNSTRSRANSTPGDLPIPITRVERVDSEPRHGEVPGTEAYDKRKGDAKPDEEVEVGDVPAPGSPTIEHSSPILDSFSRRKSSSASTIKVAPSNKRTPGSFEAYDEEADGAEEEQEEEGDDGFGDDFDDFEEGEEDAEFGDFDDGFQEASEPAVVSSAPAPAQPQSIPHVPLFPILDYTNLTTPSDIHTATQPYMTALFPSTPTPDDISTSHLPSPTTPTSAQAPIFPTPRSASLWNQLVAPPPLQPPDWVRSRIRRAFLVSLGVPVDLDEILPKSTQKKLILPSINFSAASNPTSNMGSRTTSPRNSTSISRLKASEGNASNTSLDSSGGIKRSSSRRRPGSSKDKKNAAQQQPHFDLVHAKRVCSTTEEARRGMTMGELQTHVKELEEMEGTAKEVLEFWTRETDRLLGEREAFEGVIENLVKHARKVRK